MSRFIVGVLSVLIVGAAAAAPPERLADCTKIGPDTKRLACFDALARARGANPPPSAPEKSAKAPSETEAGESIVERRIKEQARASRNPFAIAPYRRNYVLPVTYSTNPNDAAFDALDTRDNLDNFEAKFQISLQLPVWRNIFATNTDLYFAYTQLAFWQVYNTAASSPFRETNYEPEAGLIFRPDVNVLGLTARELRVGFVHQSNGRGDPLSRSWNRIFGLFVFDRGNFATALRPWYRLPEDPQDDDNPDITDFLGYFEWYTFYKWKHSTFGLMVRNNLDTGDNHGALQLDWSYPITDKLKIYLQYFTGYGESLIDYNHSTNRIGVGIQLTDWL